MASIEVKVLGLGCSACDELHRTVVQAVAQLGAEEEVRVVKVNSIAEITALGVLVAPALIVNGKLRASGRSPSLAEITTWLTTELANL